MGAFGDFLISIMRAVGYGICHQLPARSLHYGVRALPVCARDTGVFVGFTVCFIALLVAYRGGNRRYPTWPKIAILVLFVLPTYIDALTSYAGWRASSNLIRLSTGSLAGTGLAALLFPLAAGTLAYARKLKSEGQPGRLLEKWWSLPALLLVPAGITLAMWPRWPGGFWLWAPVVTLSILFTLFALNFTLISLVTEWVRGVERAPAMAVLVSFGLVFALIEIAASNRLHWLADKML